VSAFGDLLRVQEHDTALDRLRHRRETLPELARLASVTEQLVGLEAARVDAAARAGQAARAQKALEDELSSVEAKAAALDARLYSGAVTVPRELQAMQAETEALRARRSVLEDEVLEAMGVRELLDDEVGALDRRRDELDADGARLRALIAESQTAIDAELASEQAARESTAAAVPPDLARLYEQLRSRLDGIGVAPLANGRCGGCHLALPSTEIDRIRREPPDALVRCDQCGRILVRP
jgi:predicted  nucleic acid-binding Zn-ribbon protein